MKPPVFVTVDAEPDVPPFLSSSWRGMEEGMPRLLRLLEELDVPATFFATGDAARRYPAIIRELLESGHELACHGMTHRRFTELSRSEAAAEIRESSEILRTYAPVDAFRAPYLDFPEEYLGLLEDHGYRLDASRGRYKPSHWVRPRARTSLHRLDASISSSWIRLPEVVRDPLLSVLSSPVVLFVHPWEFVDLRGEDIRWDCRAGTGDPALRALRSAITRLRGQGGTFLKAEEWAGPGAGA